MRVDCVRVVISNIGDEGGLAMCAMDSVQCNGIQREKIYPFGKSYLSTSSEFLIKFRIAIVVQNTRLSTIQWEVWSM